MESDLLHGFYLDDRLIEPLKGLVVRDGLSIYLPPKAMEVLLSLASNPNQPITRDALFPFKKAPCWSSATTKWPTES